MDNQNVMNKIGDYINRKYTESLYIAGRVKFAQEEECVDLLTATADRGCNAARMYIGIWYDRFVSSMLNEVNPDVEVLHAAGAKAVDAFESYLFSYKAKEAKSDEFETAHIRVPFYYEIGLGVAKNIAKALEHKRNAEKLNQ